MLCVRDGHVLCSLCVRDGHVVCHLWSCVFVVGMLCVRGGHVVFAMAMLCVRIVVAYFCRLRRACDVLTAWECDVLTAGECIVSCIGYTTSWSLFPLCCCSGVCCCFPGVVTTVVCSVLNVLLECDPCC